jgi:hypothetical protein
VAITRAVTGRQAIRGTLKRSRFFGFGRVFATTQTSKLTRRPKTGGFFLCGGRSDEIIFQSP